MIHSLLDPDVVSDRESFIAFVNALIADRANAEELEKSDPNRYRWSGVNGWQNGTISAFLECAIAGAEAQDNWGAGSMPSWREFAVFLFLGKIYE